MRRKWSEAWIEWVPSVVDGLIRRYGGGPNRVAERMDVARSVVTGLADPKGSNPTVKTLRRFVDVFDKPVIIFPTKWDNEKRKRWLTQAYGDCIASIDGNP